MSGPAFSLENTYITKTYQAIFDDETEIVVQIGQAVPANTGDGLDITLDWQTETPDWASGLTDEQLLDLLGLPHNGSK